MDSGKFMLPFKGVRLRSSEPLRRCCSAWWSSEPGFEEGRSVCRVLPGSAGTCSWAASRARVEKAGEGKAAMTASTGAADQLQTEQHPATAREKGGMSQHCHQIPSVN